MLRISLYCLILTLLLVVCSFFSNSVGLADSQSVALSILCVAAFFWVTEVIPLFVTSLLVLGLSLVWLQPTLEAASLGVDREEFLSPFFSDIVLLFLGGFVLSKALHKHRVDEWLAAKIIELTQGSLSMLVLGVMGVTAFLSMWLSNTATAAMMMALIIPLASKLDADEPYRKMLLLCIPFAANIGGLGTPIGSPPNAIAMQYLLELEQAPSFGTWILLGCPAVIILLLMAWAVLRLLYRPKISDLPVDNEPVKLKISVEFYFVCGVCGLTVAGWITSVWHGLSAGTIALLPLIAFFGTRSLSSKDFRSLSWDVLILMGGGLCLGVVLSKSGLASSLTAMLPVESMNAYWLMVVFGCLACVMSSVMSNTATANLVMPVMLGLQVEPISPVLIGIAFACSIAMPLPVSTPPNAMAFSSEMLTVKEMAKPGVFLTVVGLLITFTIGYLWWQLIGVA